MKAKPKHPPIILRTPVTMPIIKAVVGRFALIRDGVRSDASYSVLKDATRNELHVAYEPGDDIQALFEQFAESLIEMLQHQAAGAEGAQP